MAKLIYPQRKNISHIIKYIKENIEYPWSGESHITSEVYRIVITSLKLSGKFKLEMGMYITLKNGKGRPSENPQEYNTNWVK